MEIAIPHDRDFASDMAYRSEKQDRAKGNACDK